MATYHFRALGEADLPLIARWRAAPHVRAWWGEPDGDERENLEDPDLAMWIVELEGRPFAYVQDYDVHAEASHPFSHLPPRARGIDLYIGEPDLLDRGHGAALVRCYVQRLIDAGAPAIGTDPHPDNARARRAFAKAGFVVAGEPQDTPWGRAILMEWWPRQTSS